MSSLGSYLFSSIVLCFIIDVHVSCECFAVVPPLHTKALQSLTATLPMARCTRNLEQSFQLIPAALYSNGIQQFISPLPFTQPQLQLIDNKRATRQQHSPVVQQVTISQNTALGGDRPSSGFKDIEHPFSLSKLHTHQGFDGRSSFDVFRQRMSERSNELMTPTKCPINYVFSCQPAVTEAPCDTKLCY